MAQPLSIQIVSTAASQAGSMVALFPHRKSQKSSCSQMSLTPLVKHFPRKNISSIKTIPPLLPFINIKFIYLTFEIRCSTYGNLNHYREEKLGALPVVRTTEISRGSQNFHFPSFSKKNKIKQLSFFCSNSSFTQKQLQRLAD